MPTALYFRAMTVLFIETHSALGGAQRSLLELAVALRDCGDSIHVATPRGALFDALRAKKISTHEFFEIAPGQRLRALLRLPRAICALRAIVKKTRPEILHANSIFSGILTRLANSKIPRVLHIRDLRFNTRLLRFAAKNTRAVIAISQCVHEKISALKIKSTLVQNGIDLSQYNGVRASSPCGCATRIAMVAQWAAWKRHDIFIRMAPLLREEFPGAKFFIAPGDSGNDPRYEKSMRALAAKHNVEIIPFIEDIPSFYATLSLLVHPTAEEPFGRVMYEALATRVPVVARRSPSTQHLPQHFLVDSDDPQDFANCAVKILRDPPEKIDVASFDIVATAEACHALYVDLNTKNTEDTKDTKK